MSVGKTTDRCAECGHTRYVHPPEAGCDVASHYYVDTCECSGFKEVGTVEFDPEWQVTAPGSFTIPPAPTEQETP